MNTRNTRYKTERAISLGLWRIWIGIAVAGVFLAGQSATANGQSTAAAPLFRPDAITNGLVAYWKLGETNGVRTDSSGRGHHLSEVNTTVGSASDDYWGSGERAADFIPAQGSFLSIADSLDRGLDLNGSFTIAFWLKPRSLTSAMRIIEKGGPQSTPGYGLIYRPSSPTGPSQTIRLFTTNRQLGGQRETQTGAVVDQTQKWTHFAVIYNSTNQTVAFFLNGNLSTVDTQGMLLPPEPSDTAFQMARSGFGDPYDGQLNDVAIWNVTVTPLQIKSLALGVDLSARAYRPDDVSVPPSHWWKLNEVYADVAIPGHYYADSAGSITLSSGAAPSRSSGGYIEGAGADFEADRREFLHSDGIYTDFDFGSGEFSMATWFTVESNKGVGIAAKYGEPGTGWIWYWDTSYVRLYHSGWGAAQFPTPPLNAGTWYHFAVVRQREVLRFYLDGIQIGGAQPANPTYDGGPFAFRLGSDGATSWHDGGLADFAIWKGYALTETEIRSLATGLPVQSASVVSYWRLDETGINDVRSDVIGPNHLSPSNGVGSAVGVVGTAAEFERANSESLAISSASQSGLKMSPKDGLTIMAWINPRTLAQHSGIIDAGYRDQYFLGTVQ